MLGSLKFFRLTWKLRLYDVAFVSERPRYRGKERGRDEYIQV
jgi:hypothetical protein